MHPESAKILTWFSEVRSAEEHVSRSKAEQFRAEHEQLVLIYKAAVDALFTKGYQVSDAEYKRLKLAVENARIDLDVARLILKELNLTNGRASVAIH